MATRPTNFQRGGLNNSSDSSDPSDPSDPRSQLPSPSATSTESIIGPAVGVGEVLAQTLAQTLLPPVFLAALLQAPFDGVLVFTGDTYVFCQCGQRDQRDQEQRGEEEVRDYQDYQDDPENQDARREKRALTTVRTKILTPRVVRAALTDEPTDSGYLPPAVIRCGTTIRGEFAVAFYPPSRSTITVLPVPLAPAAQQIGGGETRATRDRDMVGAPGMPPAQHQAASPSPELSAPHQMTVALPGMVFAGCARRYYVWAVKEEVFAPGLRAYHAPLPNVGIDGLICWSSNTPPEASPRLLDDAWRLFLATPFNGDYVQGKSISQRMDVRLLLTALAEKRARRFPAKELALLGYRDTIDDLVEQRLLDRSSRSPWTNWGNT